MLRPRLLFPLACAALAAACTPALATPVASTEQEAQVLGRVFPEPLVSTNYIQFDPAGGHPEFADGIRLLAKEYPRYLRTSTVARELGDPRAVSTGPDGVPAGRAGDTGDGKPFHVLQITDTSVPDKGKRYAVLMFAHSLEPCGREGVTRAMEDLLRATRDPSVVYSDGTGAGGEHRFTAAELLRRVKIFVVATSPDGWAKGDNTSRYDQSTGGGLNSNRVAWQPGWVFQTKTLADHGYRTATEPEGLANGRYLEAVRRDELGGKPFTTGLDVHGPLPTALVLGADRGISPAALRRVTDLGQRDRRAMDGVLQAYAGQAGAAGYQQVTEQVQGYRDAVRRLTPGLLDPIGGLAPPSGGSGLNATVNTAGDYPLRWATEGGVFDGIGYDASSTWAGFMSGQLGASAITIEANCAEMAPWVPASMQLYVDNVRAAVRTTLAATAAAGEDEPQRDLGGRVGFFDDGHRVTDRDGNPSPVPAGFPGAPLQQQQAQQPYDVKPTDYFRDLPEVTRQRPRAVSGPRLHRELPRLSTLVVADQRSRQTKRLAAWVRKGGNLVLTDSALRLLPRFGIGTDADVRRDFGYVGYADFDRTTALAKGLPARARETFDPVGLGMPLLMERDGYWHCNTGESPGCSSGTENSAPIWTVPAALVRARPGAELAGTADPPATRRTTREGTAKDRAEVFTIPYGKGRIVALGALLATPSEALPHPYGLLGYTITTAGQEVLLRAMTWKGPQARHLARPFAHHTTPPAPAQTRSAGSRGAVGPRGTAGNAVAAGGPAVLPVTDPGVPDAAARAYATEMLAHHGQGIAIADAAARGTHRAGVRAVAAGMVLAQRAEAAQLRGLLAAWPAVRGHGASRPALLCPLGARGLASAAGLAGLRHARGTAADRRFVALMLRHHRGAIRMSRLAVARTASAAVAQIASSVLRTQEAEVRELVRLRDAAGQQAPFAGVAGL